MCNKIGKREEYEKSMKKRGESTENSDDDDDYIDDVDDDDPSPISPHILFRQRVLSPPTVAIQLPTTIIIHI